MFSVKRSIVSLLGLIQRHKMKSLAVLCFLALLCGALAKNKRDDKVMGGRGILACSPARLAWAWTIITGQRMKMFLLPQLYQLSEHIQIIGV
ncbi:jg25430 [Pararge aegeria aegeria]|uniref:Jg25430 protein n=1 Tax=Pararge aegeria aegeria TaxID=348720 RepID=A0A8S4QWM5_9NEOP|nr:jg25430 [Pararge aegeria aegeria]